MRVILLPLAASLCCAVAKKTRQLFTLAALVSGAALCSQPILAQYVQQGAKLIGSGTVGSGSQGSGVAISGDGNTAIVGGPLDNGAVGAAWVWTRSAGNWAQQGLKLVGTGATHGTYGSWQGSAVAVSADGNTAIVGGYNDNDRFGAAWVWTRSGGLWTQYPPKLVGTGGVGTIVQQGYSVALSADGNTAMVGGPSDNASTGAVWVWTRSGGVWSQQAKLVSPNFLVSARQGTSVALSADGNTAVVGGYSDNNSFGAAWVWTRSAGVWAEGPKLVGSNANTNPQQGVSVSISGDGNTIIVGGNGDNNNTGAAWVWTQSAGIWAQQGAKLVGTGATGSSHQGISVSLSADGNTAMVASNYDNNNTGTAWIWTRFGGVWTQQGNKVSSDAVFSSNLGTSGSLSGDGNTFILGGPTGQVNNTGAAWVFAATSPTFPATVSFDGRLRDRVSKNHAAAGLIIDGDPDGTFTLTLPAGNAAKSMTNVDIVGPNGNHWDTVPNNSPVPLWVVGVAGSLDGPLLNNADGSVNFQTGSPGIFKLFIANPTPSVFVPGSTFTVRATLSDGSVAVGAVTIGSIPTTDLGLFMQATSGGVPLTGSVATGQVFQYQGKVTNYGPATATGVEIWINLPAGIVFDSNDSANPGACTQVSGGSPVICVSIPLTATPGSGDVNTIIFNVHATQAASFNTTATVYSKLTEPTPDPHSNTYTVNTTTNSAGDLALSIAGDSNPVQVDAPLIYTATLRNNGPQAQTNVVVDFTTDPSAIYLPFQNTSQNCAYAAHHLICTIGTMNSGAQVILTFQVRPKAATGSFTIVGTASGDLFDQITANNTGVTLTTTVVPNTPPANDNFPTNLLTQLGTYVLPGMPGTVAGSTVVQGTVLGTNVGATPQTPIIYDPTGGEINHAGAPGGKSVWYVWIPPSTPGTVEFSTGATSFNASRSTFNTLLEVYDEDVTNSPGAVVSIASNNNATTSDLTSLVSFEYKPGHVYSIAVDGYKGATGFIALHWNVPLHATPAVVPQVITSMYPAITCSRDSDQTNDICKFSYDALTHDHILHVYGTGFTTNSTVLMNGKPLSGFDLDGTPLNGFTERITDANGVVTELVAHIPPSPDFEGVAINRISVLTPAPPGVSTVTAMSGATATVTNSYLSNTGLEKTITLKNARVPVHQTQTVCGHLDFFGGDETCIDFTNDGTSGNVDIVVDPTYFAVYAYCSTLFPGKDRASFDQRLQCSSNNGYGAEKLLRQLGTGFAINPRQAIAGGILTVAPHINTPGSVNVAQGVGAQLLVSGSSVSLISQDGSTLVPAGLNLVSDAAGTLVSDAAGTLVSNSGGTLVATGGGNLISHDGSSIVAVGGRNLTGQDGATFRSGATGKAQGLKSLSDDLKKGSGGWFIVRSSGNTNPVYTSTTNEDGSKSGKLAVTFDSTSNPRSQNLLGLAFAVALNPAIVQFDSTSITVDRSAVTATLNLTRTGDTAVPISVQYTTSDDTAIAGIDYQATSGNLFFAQGETTKQIAVPLATPPASSSARSFQLIIGNALGGAILLPNVAIVTRSAGLAIDIDGNGSYEAVTDGLLMIRYLFGLTGVPLTSGAVGPGSTRATADIVQYLNSIKANLDVDGNGHADALTDGLMLTRYLSGLRGPALITGAIGTGATRTTAAQIEAYIRSLLP